MRKTLEIVNAKTLKIEKLRSRHGGDYRKTNRKDIKFKREEMKFHYVRKFSRADNLKEFLKKNYFYSKL